MSVGCQEKPVVAEGVHSNSCVFVDEEAIRRSNWPGLVMYRKMHHVQELQLRPKGVEKAKGRTTATGPAKLAEKSPHHEKVIGMLHQESMVVRLFSIPEGAISLK